MNLSAIRARMRPHPILQTFQALPVPEDTPALTSLAGTFSAPILLLTEHPTPEEFEKNIPFISPAAMNYMSAMEANTGLSLSRDFLIVPHSRFGKKANKASTEHTFPFLHEILPTSHVKCVVCIGMTAFGYTFGGGRKTHARSIIGNPMFMPNLYTKPVFVMPDTSLVVPDPDDFRSVRFAREKLNSVQTLTLKLKAFLETLP